MFFTDCRCAYFHSSFSERSSVVFHSNGASGIVFSRSYTIYVGINGRKLNHIEEIFVVRTFFPCFRSIQSCILNYGQSSGILFVYFVFLFRFLLFFFFFAFLFVVVAETVSSWLPIIFERVIEADSSVPSQAALSFPTVVVGFRTPIEPTLLWPMPSVAS